MKFNRLIWAILVIGSLLCGYFMHRATALPIRIGETIGAAFALLLVPALILGIVVGVGKLFKNPPSEMTRRVIFFFAWGFCMLSSVAQQFRDLPATREQAIANCMKAAKDSAGYDITKVIDLHRYCDCAIGKLYKRNKFDSTTLTDLRDRNSPLFNELIMTCAQDAMLDAKKKQGAVVGMREVDTIPVLNTTHGIKVGLRIGNKNYYFTFDSGSSDILVSTQLEKELKAQGLIQEDLGTVRYELADGREIECRKAMVKNIQIGSFLVNSTEVAFYDGDIDFLLGKSFLDHFSSWSFTKDRSELILKK